MRKHLYDRRAGFTLIELLIVVVIIGILAAIAIPRFGSARERTYYSSMRSDLRNLATQQELFYSDPANNYVYTGNQADLGFSASQGVTIAITPDGGEGWAATATHNAITTPGGPHCGVCHGPVDNATLPAASGPASGSASGVVVCTDQAGAGGS
jgi:type IV pilus assembly protein PilA